MRRTSCGWCAAHTAALREKSPRPASILPPPCPPADPQIIVTNAPLFVPEGPRRKLAGGKSAQRARPPVAPPNGPCPSGASKKFFEAYPRNISALLVTSGHFLRCPAGARIKAAPFPGAASAGADLPPANLLRRPSGTGTGRPRRQRTRREEIVRGFHRSFRVPRAATGDPSRSANTSARGRSPPAAATHLRRRRKFQPPRLGCCRCDRGPVARRCGCGPQPHEHRPLPPPSKTALRA